MELEFHRLDLRYEKLRKRSPRKERQLLGSLSEMGQLLPIVVVAGGEGERHIVVDGYKRVRALRRLAMDTVFATVWEMQEAEALLLERLMRTAESDGPLEQGWLLQELRERFDMPLGELARRFDKTGSWVSRRLSLVRDLPEAIQEHVRAGSIAAHAAMKYLVPLARANVQDCLALAKGIAPLGLSTRQVGELYGGWLTENSKTRALILTDPGLYLRAQQEARGAPETPKSPVALLLDDLGALGGVARRAKRRLGAGLRASLLPDSLGEIQESFLAAKADVEAFLRRFEKEMTDARPEHAYGDPQAP